MLAPSRISSSTKWHWMRMRCPAVRTVPTSSTMPVNIWLFDDVGFDGELIRRDRVQPYPMQLNGVGASQAASAARHRKRLQSTQDFRRVVKENLVDDARFERRPIQFASRFNHQRPVLFAREPRGEFGKVSASTRTIEH